jgi:DNA-3-methyladenine glycosylase I
MLTLEGAQAGLSWITILKKRENYRHAFDNFNVHKVAAYDQSRINALLNDAGIVRNRLKISATISNARVILEICEQQGSFSDYIWQFVEGSPVINHWKNSRQVPVTTLRSDIMSKTLKKAGFRFVGSTICYAFMQAVGMVNDHTIDCFCYKGELEL